MNNELTKQIFGLIKLNNKLIAVESPLQERVRLLINLASECQRLDINCYLWTLEDDALQQLSTNEEGLSLKTVNQYQASAKSRREHYFEILRFWKTTDLEGILILEGIFPWLGSATTDPDFFLTAEWIKSALINLKLYNCNANKTAILLGSNASLSSDIAPEVPTVIQQLPATLEINSYLSQVLPDYSHSDIHATANASIGMYLADIGYGIRQAIANHEITPDELVSQLSAYKIELFKRIYSIQFLQPPATPIGGLELMQSAFKTYKRLLTTLAKAYNLRLPKGILLIGPPGTGKSYSAKASSAQLGLPLIILEWGSFRSYGNLAEYKLKSLLALVDRINRVILYLDDFDKGFAGDDDLSKRLAGMLLTWMQERTSEVLIIASANNIQWLPPELTRSGRFDEIFKVDLPNYGERHEIFKIHLARFDPRFRDRGDGYSEEEWKRLLKATQRCVGAEIQAIVERAAVSSFCQMFGDDVSPLQELPPLGITLSALLAARQSMNPLAIREADRVESMRNIAALHGLPSSPIDSSIYSLGNVDIFGET
ncbi:AAA family ATPase [Nostoc sp. 'Peltigera membranacea cyanobiont' 213]|uniref:ATP-binding protein n=1 Tax=Nostoc cyanobionts TaxID=3123326 RepID=UPI000B95A88C|nr:MULTISPECIES: ATP-binding protein [unclassified Nostoc]OYD91350.1 AAA family ATPase [Nostoc sp. 'Peltigera membranacea cyanobiont' 213]OYE04032.1 AAA family ATPase [Nostoc sp. 'Peltigera membranacea cyanobiont' 232]